MPFAAVRDAPPRCRPVPLGDCLLLLLPEPRGEIKEAVTGEGVGEDFGETEDGGERRWGGGFGKGGEDTAEPLPPPPKEGLHGNMLEVLDGPLPDVATILVLLLLLLLPREEGDTRLPVRMESPGDDATGGRGSREGRGGGVTSSPPGPKQQPEQEK